MCCGAPGKLPYTEKKLGVELLALWEKGDLPADANVTRVTLIPFRGDRPVVAWKAGRIMLPEGDVQPGEGIDAAISRVLLEQCGVLNAKWTALGHFRARATSLSKSQVPGSVSYQVLYAAEAGSLADFPADEAYERRIIPQRDLNALLQNGYAEVRREYADALDEYLIERLKVISVT
jgi:ADP-ribose pyrophosphatase YjhB (NUDIX family)